MLITSDSIASAQEQSSKTGKGIVAEVYSSVEHATEIALVCMHAYETRVFSDEQLVRAATLSYASIDFYESLRHPYRIVQEYIEQEFAQPFVRSLSCSCWKRSYSFPIANWSFGPTPWPDDSLRQMQQEISEAEEEMALLNAGVMRRLQLLAETYAIPARDALAITALGPLPRFYADSPLGNIKNSY